MEPLSQGYIASKVNTAAWVRMLLWNLANKIKVPYFIFKFTFFVLAGLLLRVFVTGLSLANINII